MPAGAEAPRRRQGLLDHRRQRGLRARRTSPASGGSSRARRARTDQFGHVVLGGVGEALGHEIEQRTGYETRVTVLGHVQRGGTPTPRDRVLATRYGLKAADLAHEGQYGQMAALNGDAIVAVPLSEATAELKTVPPHWYDTARAFFG